MLEDNVRTPSGIGYWWACREAACRHLGLGDDRRPAPLDDAAAAAAAARGPAAARRRAHRRAGQRAPTGSTAGWPSGWTSRRRAGRPRGARRPPVARRRADRRRVPPFERRRASTRRWADSSIQSFARARGAGQLLRHGRRRRQARARLCRHHDPLLPRRGAAPAARSRPSISPCRRCSSARWTRFDELVVKDRGSYGGMGVVVGPCRGRGRRRSPRPRPRRSRRLHRAAPRSLSTHPTEIDGELAPRHVDLRPFVFLAAPDDPRA